MIEKESQQKTIGTQISEVDGLSLEIFGARVHNLQNIDLAIPRNQLVVFTGLSGSGKSSLAFDTIYAEGQRRYMDTFSSYARQFIGGLERPDVDEINGLSPVISIEQKSTSSNPRSTVGTITEVYDFLRLLYARAADAISPVTGQPLIKYSEQQIIELIADQYADKDILLLSPIVKGRKGHYRELFEQFRRLGYLRARIDGEIREINFGLQLDRYKTHDIELVIDKINLKGKSAERLNASVKTALKQGKGTIHIVEQRSGIEKFLSKKLMDPATGTAFDEPEPNTFSFNSPYGACPHCNGLGTITEIDLDKIIPDPSISIKKGGFAPLGEAKASWIFRQLEALGEKFGFTLSTPISEIPEEAINAILYGSDEVLKVKNEYLGVTSSYTINFDGLVNYIKNQSFENATAGMRKWAGNFMNLKTCPDCGGARLKKDSLNFRIQDKTIANLSEMELSELNDWFLKNDLFTDPRKKLIAHEIVREITDRLRFLLDVGLDYLALNRPAGSLSGGEAQRIRLATQIGSQLVGVLYILDEPSIGLHQRDNQRLIKALQDLRDVGNSVIVVEHDKDMILASDFIVDIGPGAGKHGGKIVATGTPAEMLNCNSITCCYLSGKKQIKIPAIRRKGNGEFLTITGASGNNLKDVTLKLPLGVLTCITGVSGSGKSTLINETLYPILSQHFYRSDKKPLKYKKIIGLDKLDKVIEIDQSPIGRTPRSNPATYTGVFDEIRKLYTTLPEARIRGYQAGRFSFNVKGGRCETCRGAGVRIIEMNFLPDVHVPCETCGGKRYNRETLEVRFKGKSINDVLNLTINQAVEFFENIPFILHKIRTLKEVGLGYITLGQQSTTLSGGEAQRVKLATELSKKDTGKTMYILDEPTTGLHFEDVNVLLGVLNRLVDKGNTVLVIEHNMEVIKVADYIIDLGPGGGRKGGNIIAAGTPESLAMNPESVTGQYIKKELDDWHINNNN
ncbi:MAG: excinuclease ABC subunit UvrA [Lentimicrobium sp.]|nr:excinuclease ABC subunit UvrA [Lentimicrobium sp.]